MAVITQDRFDPLRRFVGVRLQQGVPIVDADENEREDVRKFELRAFLKWFVGDGVPEGSNAFRVGLGAAAADNDFTIFKGSSGAQGALSNLEFALSDRCGRCLVDGLDVLIDADLTYKGQDLHVGKGASATALAARWGVLPIPDFPVTPPAATVTAFLDVWERLVTAAEFPDLILPALSTESCARTRREWVVRVRAGDGVPGRGDADHKAGHNYYALARIARRAGDLKVQAADVTDLREQRLRLPPASLIEDVMGTTADRYRRGQDRPPISLRDAINALLIGQLPATADAAIAPSLLTLVSNSAKRAYFLDGTQAVLAAWTSNRVNGTDQALVARLDLRTFDPLRPDDGFKLPSSTAATTGPAHRDPHAAGLPNGDVLLVCQRIPTGATEVVIRQAAWDALAAATPLTVANASGTSAVSAPFVVVRDDLAAVFYHFNDGTAQRWQYRLYRHTDKSFTTAAKDLSSTATTQKDLHAALDRDKNIWAVFSTGGTVTALRVEASTGNPADQTNLGTLATVPSAMPFVLGTRAGPVYAFWTAAGGVLAKRFTGGTWKDAGGSGTDATAVRDTTGDDKQPAAVEDATGAVWLFWTRTTTTTTTTTTTIKKDVYYSRRDPVVDAWGPARQLTTDVKDDNQPFALVAPDKSVWVFWQSDRLGDATNPFFKRLITVL